MHVSWAASASPARERATTTLILSRPVTESGAMLADTEARQEMQGRVRPRDAEMGDILARG